MSRLACSGKTLTISYRQWIVLWALPSQGMPGVWVASQRGRLIEDQFWGIRIPIYISRPGVRVKVDCITDCFSPTPCICIMFSYLTCFRAFRLVMIPFGAICIHQLALLCASRLNCSMRFTLAQDLWPPVFETLATDQSGVGLRTKRSPLGQLSCCSCNPDPTSTGYYV